MHALHTFILFKDNADIMDNIPKYPQLISFLKEIGHYQDSYKIMYPTEEPTNLNVIIGLEIYRLLSSRSPEEIKITDDIIFRQPAEKAKLGEGVSEQNIEDILREDVVLRILECHPMKYIDAYKKDDGHIRIYDFSNCFTGAHSKYAEWISGLKSRARAHRLIEQDERNRVKQAVNRNKDKLKKLIVLLKSEQEPLPEWGLRLEKNLQEYGLK